MKEAVAKLAQRLKNVVAMRRRRAKRGQASTSRRRCARISSTVAFRFASSSTGGCESKPAGRRCCATSRIRCATSRASCCSSCTRCRTSTRACAASSSSARSGRSRSSSRRTRSRTRSIRRSPATSSTCSRTPISVAPSASSIAITSPPSTAARPSSSSGDARNNYNLPHEWVLRDIQQRAKQVIWLNPESRMTWGFGDSEMDRYQPYCDLVEECRNLNQLYRVDRSLGDAELVRRSDCSIDRGFSFWAESPSMESDAMSIEDSVLDERRRPDPRPGDEDARSSCCRTPRTS